MRLGGVYGIELQRCFANVFNVVISTCGDEHHAMRIERQGRCKIILAVSEGYLARTGHDAYKLVEALVHLDSYLLTDGYGHHRQLKIAARPKCRAEIRRHKGFLADIEDDGLVSSVAHFASQKIRAVELTRGARWRFAEPYGVRGKGRLASLGGIRGALRCGLASAGTAARVSARVGAACGTARKTDSPLKKLAKIYFFEFHSVFPFS